MLLWWTAVRMTTTVRKDGSVETSFFDATGREIAYPWILVDECQQTRGDTSGPLG